MASSSVSSVSTRSIAIGAIAGVVAFTGAAIIYRHQRRRNRATAAANTSIIITSSSVSDASPATPTAAAATSSAGKSSVLASPSSENYPAPLSLRTPGQPLRAVCVFCGSKPGVNAAYSAAARALGEELVKRKISLVYGGGTVGLMGTIATTVQNGGGQVTGIIPRSLTSREVAGDTIGTTVMVNSMHKRKQLMFGQCDAFVVLPGGFGTFEELFEMVTWQYLGIHAKPIAVLNVNGFFEPLRAIVNHSINEGFVRATDVAAINFCDTPAELLDCISSVSTPPSNIKWLHDISDA